MKRLLLSKKASKILSLALAIALLALYVPANITASAMSGSGTAGSPYIIRTLADLQEVDNDLDAHYRLGANINISGWYIGSPSDEFTGNFDGNGYTLSGINGSALFAATEDATIKNLTITGSYASNGRSAGALINTAKGTLTLSNIVSHVNLVEGSFHNVGGLVGEADEVTISDCVVTGRVEGDNNNVGGLVGLINDTGTITRSYTTGNITGGQNTGGIAACFAGEISQCFSTGNIYGVSYVGGIVGDLHAHRSDLAKINNKSNVVNCYSTGDISSSGNYVGGIVGSMYDYTHEISVSRCYVSGDISGDVYIGGIAGYLASDYGSVRYCYVLSDNFSTTSRANHWARVAYFDYSVGISSLFSSNYVLDTINISMTTYEPPTPTGTNTLHGATITYADTQIASAYNGWDFSNVWIMDSRYDYPQLRNVGGYKTFEVEPKSMYIQAGYSKVIAPTVFLNTLDSVANAVSSDPNVLTVANNFDGTFTISGVSAGRANITFISAEGFRQTIQVTVCEVWINIQSVEYTDFSPLPIKYAEYVLEAQIEPADVANVAGIQVDWQPIGNVGANPDNQWQAGSVVMIPTTATVNVTIGDALFTNSLLLLPE